MQTVCDENGVRKTDPVPIRSSLFSFNHVSGGGSIEHWQVAGQANATALATTTPTANYLYAVPFVAPRLGTIDQLAINVTSAGAGSGVYLGIYEYTGPGNLYPGALVVDCGTVSTASTGVKLYTTGLPITVRPGKLYFAAYVASATAPQVRSLSATGQTPLWGTDTSFGTSLACGLRVVFTYAALPSTFTASGALLYNSSLPAITYRWAS